MSLHILRTETYDLLTQEVLKKLIAVHKQQGTTTFLLPSFEQAVALKKQLAAYKELSFGTNCITIFTFLKELWQLIGDGTHIVDSMERSLIVSSLMQKSSCENGTKTDSDNLGTSSGKVQLFENLVSKALPYLISNPTLDKLSTAEKDLVRLARDYATTLKTYNLREASDVACNLAQKAYSACIYSAAVVCVGFSNLLRYEHDFISSLAKHTQVYVLTQELTSERIAPVELEDSNIGFLIAHGPLAEAELIARRVDKLAQAGCLDATIIVPDFLEYGRSLVEKLCARKCCVDVNATVPFSSFCAAKALINFLKVVCDLKKRSDTESDFSDYGSSDERNLPNMDWWPPQTLSDFLLSDISQVPSEKAYALDASWRKNRILTPQQVLDSLQSQKKTSETTVRATQEILRGRFDRVVKILLQAYISRREELKNITLPAGETDEYSYACSLAVLKKAYQLAEELSFVLKKFHSLSQNISDLYIKQLQSAAVSLRFEVLPKSCGEHRCKVKIVSQNTALQAPFTKTSALILCGQTATSAPIPKDMPLWQDILVRMNIELQPNLDVKPLELQPSPLAEARSGFMRLILAAQDYLFFERSLKEKDGSDAYSSVMLGEFLCSYDVEFGDDPHDVVSSLEKKFSSDMISCQTEMDVQANLLPSGSTLKAQSHINSAQTGQIDLDLKDFILVCPETKNAHADLRPLLSASQIETYLECPYKWFTLRRLKLSDADARFGGAEKGTFVHRVLELTHTALKEKDKDIHTHDGLVAAHDLLNDFFTEHLSHQYLLKKGKPQYQALVPHTSLEEKSLEELRESLHTFLEFESALFKGFAPTFFEWRFGRKEQIVEYAGMRIAGTIDRLDIDKKGRALIIDYKHKKLTAKEYDSIVVGEEGFCVPPRVQTLIYAQIVRRLNPELKVVGALYVSTSKDATIAGVIQDDVVDEVFGSTNLRQKNRKNMILASDTSFEYVQSESAFYDFLDSCEAAIKDRLQGMEEGYICADPSREDASVCAYCPVLNCEKRIEK